MGSAVDREGLSASLSAYREAGLGGVEITPIYGVRGAESRFVRFLSPEWVPLLEHALSEARRLDLGVDIATGTGWPFGGPWVGPEDACRTLVPKTYRLQGGERLAEPVRLVQEPLVRALGNQDQLVEPVEANPNLQALALEQVVYAKALPLLTLMAFPSSGEPVDLTARVTAGGHLDWVAPAGTWTLHALFLGWHGKLVERAAPGGEGNVIDHFSTTAIQRYLKTFDTAFTGRDVSGLRAFFNDSYEVDDATGQSDWTSRFLEEFERRRGYDLRRHLDALLAPDGGLRSARVLADYRETISDLLLDTFTREWHAWAVGRGAIVRNQAHGSPANILDLYALSEIPETEGNDALRVRWASSAAHVAGRKLIAAEAATWLGEHFRSTLADVRKNLDLYFLNGVNHVVYHGTNYSPAGEAWPGWLFYAAVHFNPQSSWWDDFGALNRYVTRVQSFLQAGRPDHDLLLYHPFYDSLAVPGRARLRHYGGSQAPAEDTAFAAASAALLKRGYAFDFISDRQLHGVHVQDRRLQTGGVPYRVLVVPESRFVPLETFERFVTLAREGATVVVYRGLPAEVAGLRDLANRSKALRAAAGRLGFKAAGPGVREARVGKGVVLLGADLEVLLSRAGVLRETLVDRGLEYARRTHAVGHTYFLSNRTEEAFAGWVPLQTAAASVVVFDPMTGGRGWAAVRQVAGRPEVYLQLRRGESRVLLTRAEMEGGEAVRYLESAGSPIPIAGPWTLRFVAGGPERPADMTVESLGSWTALPLPGVRSFSGSAAYITSFPHPGEAAEAWRLDLGVVRESATVRLNGQELGTLIGPEYGLILDPGQLQGENWLQITVSNLMANRIADLDRRGVSWKKFYNVNFPSRLRENRGPDGLFTAAAWEPLDSGLLGPVTVTPLSSVALEGEAAPQSR